ncbi:MAG: EAL domain-containing protein [Aromatoleum sp.]|jgi:diguanylate cyclase (GGDEF)-like protein/PAS domain S-box-containing protein|uniref:putative bifunctional diguanylate cyclase/phosphodiesterase n=1 Tax=Aromatoleum sp. TaxID=2307007 RepID=UPI0028940AAD|nr:EAL domain-containing protein [Aromatoleum sp.]MDT3670002.1 EAL domain-containing protein [Aromatoleum sp.]
MRKAMFRLSRYFSLASGVAVILMTMLLSWVYRSSEIVEHTGMAGSRNEVLARGFSNVVWPAFGLAVVDSAGLDADALRERPVTRQLHARLGELSAGVPIIKIKIYDLNGTAVFSSVPREIGEDKRSNPGFLAARDGRVMSELVHRGRMSVTEGEIEDVDVVSSYIPIRSEEGGTVRAVFELYTDVTADVAEIRGDSLRVLFGLFAIFGAFYVVLMLIVRRADQILQGQYASLRASEGDLLVKSAELQLANARMRMAAGVFERSIQGIVIVDTQLNAVEVNRAFTEITGYTIAETIGRKPPLFASDWHDDAFYEAMWRTVRTQGSWQGEITDRRKNGEVYNQWLTVSADFNASGDIVHYIGMFYDVTEKRLAEERIARLAYYDALTGLANRRLFEDRVEHALQLARRQQTHVAVMFIDLDRFKPVNDSLGHKAGDVLLTQVAERLASIVRDCDTTARLGGDEFALLLPLDPRHGRSETGQVAQRILDALSAPFVVEGHEIITGASIGVSFHPRDGDDLETLLKHADVAMYQAKRAGRNRYRFFRPAMNAGALERLDTEEGLRRALARDEFELYFQPKVSTHSGHLTGAEALVRWRHPERGLVPPGEFIPVAEESGLIVSIGAWVLEEACRTVKTWEDRLPRGFRVAVNLSARQLRGHVDETVRRALATTGVDPSRVELELTESMLMEGTERAIGLMERLAALGVKLALDDFGTGYSSLAYLKRFPLKQLKIDRSFVRDLPADAGARAIVEATIALAHSLGLTVVAEGVETEAQREFLRHAGCTECQGFLFSPPVSAAQFERILADSRRLHCA